MIQILLIEDDPILGRGLSLNLELEKYQVHWVNNLHSAFAAERDVHSDLVILDLGLPDGSGLEYLRELRKKDRQKPVLILTAQVDEDSVVEGLQAGANDYVRKPFGNRELLARVKTVMRRPEAQHSILKFEELVLNLEQRKALFQETEIKLNRREFDILAYFVQHADIVVTRETLLKKLDPDAVIFDRTIDSHISHLRSRLKQAGALNLQLSSIYGVGYRLEKV